MTRVTMLLGTGIFLLGSTLHAAVPPLINFQGIIKNASGDPVPNTPHSLRFTIYDSANGGNTLWQETQLIVPTNGLFNVLLGSMTPVPDSAFNNQNRFLGVKVGGDPEMTPRQQLVSLSYAYRVSSVDGASGGNITSKVSIGPSHTNTGAHAFVVGESNTVSGHHSTAVGGFNNSASGLGSSIGGGSANTASGYYATVPGGLSNTASGAYSLAAGVGAKADHHGTFVWADGNTEAEFTSTADNQFLIRSAGGVGIGTNAPLKALHIGGGDSSSILLDNAGDLFWRSASGAAKPVLTLHSDDNVYFDASAASTSDLIFRTNTTQTERMRIADDGKVGIGTAGPNSTLHANGSFATAVRIAAVNTTLDGTDNVIICMNPAPMEIDLPEASSCAGRQYTIKRTINFLVTIDPFGEETIDGEATYEFQSYSRNAVTIISDGANWHILSYYIN